jgi:HSP20 family protein
MNIIKRFRKNNGRDDLARSGDNRLPAFRQEMGDAFDRVRRFFDEPWSFAAELAPWPAIDINEDEKSLALRVDVPGISAKDIEVDVSGNLLTVRGSREEEKRSKSGGISRHERHTGSFLRTITLPTYVDSGKLDAKYDKGVLTIIAPKIPGAGPKRVPVKTE